MQSQYNYLLYFSEDTNSGNEIEVNQYCSAETSLARDCLMKEFSVSPLPGKY